MLGVNPLAFGYNPLMGSGTDYMSLPQIANTTDLLALPFFQDYSARASALDDFDESLINMSGRPVAYPAAGTSVQGDFYAQMSENQARMSQYQLEQATRLRQNSLIQSAPMERLRNAASILQGKIVENEQDQIPVALSTFLQEVREAYDPEGEADEETIMARAKTLYRQMTGQDLTAEIRANGHSDITDGFLNTFCFGLFGNNKSAAQNIADIDGTEVSSKAKKLNKLGRAVGDLATGVAGGALAGAAIGWMGGPIGAGVGALIGGGIALVKSIFS